MRIIIVGCGRVGSGLARTLSLRGHSVTVVDQNPDTFERLGSAFKGNTVAGVGFDRDVLIRAGIETADGLAAVTPSDEGNVISARMASHVFHVPKVIARVFDPQHAETYRRLGVQTIDLITWGVNRIAELLTSSPLDCVLSLGADANIVEADLPLVLDGRSVKDLTIPGEISVVAISRSGRTVLPTQGTVLKAGDLLHIAVLSTSMDRLRRLLSL
jgi:trk system potassium uptake protein